MAALYTLAERPWVISTGLKKASLAVMTHGRKGRRGAVKGRKASGLQ